MKKFLFFSNFKDLSITLEAPKLLILCIINLTPLFMHKMSFRCQKYIHKIFRIKNFFPPSDLSLWIAIPLQNWKYYVWKDNNNFTYIMINDLLET